MVHSRSHKTDVVILRSQSLYVLSFNDSSIKLLFDDKRSRLALSLGADTSTFTMMPYRNDCELQQTDHIEVDKGRPLSKWHCFPFLSSLVKSSANRSTPFEKITVLKRSSPRVESAHGLLLKDLKCHPPLRINLEIMFLLLLEFPN